MSNSLKNLDIIYKNKSKNQKNKIRHIKNKSWKHKTTQKAHKKIQNLKFHNLKFPNSPVQKTLKFQNPNPKSKSKIECSSLSPPVRASKKKALSDLEAFWMFSANHWNQGAKLFTKDILLPGRFPEPSQKIVSATASRYVIFWANSISQDLVRQCAEASALSRAKKVLPQ